MRGSRGSLLGMILAGTGVAAAVVMGDGSAEHAPDTLTLAAGAGSAEYVPDTATLAAVAPVIMTGTVTSETFRGYMGGYNGAGELNLTPPAPPGSAAPAFAVPVVEYGLDVGYVFKDVVGATSAGHVVLQLAGQPTPGGDPCGSEDSMPPLLPVGTTSLYFLSLQPDGVGLGLYYGADSRLDLSGPEVMNTACTPMAPYWTTNTSPGAFLGELMAALGS